MKNYQEKEQPEWRNKTKEDLKNKGKKEDTEQRKRTIDKEEIHKHRT